MNMLTMNKAGARPALLIWITPGPLFTVLLAAVAPMLSDLPLPFRGGGLFRRERSCRS